MSYAYQIFGLKIYLPKVTSRQSPIEDKLIHPILTKAIKVPEEI